MRSWFHFLPVLKAFLSPHYFCLKSLHALGGTVTKKEPDATTSGEKQAATIPGNKFETIFGWNEMQEYQSGKIQSASVCMLIRYSTQFIFDKVTE